MEVVEEIQPHQGCKFPKRIGNGNENGDEKYPDEEEDVEVKRKSNAVGGGGGGGGIDFARLCGWPSSRIVRVSRASGGKDRHSKVLTSKGLRDRRVRLSVNTAIQFYDLQDRLGVDQPSKAVEWLLKAAASSISELPSIDTSSFPGSPKLQLSNEKRSSDGLDLADVELDGSLDLVQQQQNGVLSKSACSSPSETSKGSGLSLSRSESRIKARERARGRAAEKEKDKESENNYISQLHHHHNHDHDQHNHNLNPISQNASSFTELLTSGMNNGNNVSSITNNNNSTNGTNTQNHSRGDGGGRHWSSSPMDYFATGLLGPASTRTSHGFSGQIHFGEQYQDLQSFSCVPEHFATLVTGGNNGDNNNNNNNAYNLNFTISSSSTSGLAGFNRGTLQSNSSTPSLLPQIQRFSSIDGSSPTFLIGSNTPVENNHHFLPGYDARLQLYYGNSRHSDHKGKEKS